MHLAPTGFGKPEKPFEGAGAPASPLFIEVLVDRVGFNAQSTGHRPSAQARMALHVPQERSKRCSVPCKGIGHPSGALPRLNTPMTDWTERLWAFFGEHSHSLPPDVLVSQPILFFPSLS